MSTIPERASQPFPLGPLTLRNRIVGAPHGRGMLDDGLALPGDADYWRRVAAGGAAMVTVGGTTTAPESTWRRRIVTEAWRADGIPGLALRAEAIRSEGAVAALQIVHLGRETTGAEMWFAPVAPSSVRSPREPTRPVALSEADVDAVVEGFRISSVNAAQAGFQVVELHAAHGYLLAQFLSPSTNLRAGAATVTERVQIVSRIAGAVRQSAPELILGIRLSIDGELEGGFSLDTMCELLPVISPLFDYVSMTIGVRTTYVRDMATTEPPLLGAIERLRPQVDRPLLVSQAFVGPSRSRPRCGRSRPRRRGPTADRGSTIPVQGHRRPRGGGASVRLVQRGLPRSIRFSCARSIPISDRHRLDLVRQGRSSPGTAPERPGAAPSGEGRARWSARAAPDSVRDLDPAGARDGAVRWAARLGDTWRAAAAPPAPVAVADRLLRELDRSRRQRRGAVGDRGGSDLLAGFDHVVTAIGSEEVLPVCPGYLAP